MVIQFPGGPPFAAISFSIFGPIEVNTNPKGISRKDAKTQKNEVAGLTQSRGERRELRNREILPFQAFILFVFSAISA